MLLMFYKVRTLNGNLQFVSDKMDHLDFQTFKNNSTLND
jgi:hypothetical protein